MPDTGAPWNIPYVASTDLVSDWPADSLALANAIDAGLDAAGNAGIGSNVVSAAKTDTFTTTSTSPVDITGLSATITPSSATSKVLVIAYLNVSCSTPTQIAAAQLYRDATEIADGSDGTARNVAVHFRGSADSIFAQPVVYLDSPATTSATVYKFQMFVTGGTGYLNRQGSTDASGVASAITLLEVAA